MLACFLKELQNIFIQSSLQYKVCLFSVLSNTHIVDIKYLPIFVVEDFSELFSHLSTFLIKDSGSA